MLDCPAGGPFLSPALSPPRQAQHRRPSGRKNPHNSCNRSKPFVGWRLNSAAILLLCLSRGADRPAIKEYLIVPINRNKSPLGLFQLQSHTCAAAAGMYVLVCVPSYVDQSAHHLASREQAPCMLVHNTAVGLSWSLARRRQILANAHQNQKPHTAATTLL